MAQDDIEFVDGLIVKAPHAKAPSFVKASISIKVAALMDSLEDSKRKDDEWINIDVKESKSAHIHTGRFRAARSAAG